VLLIGALSWFVPAAARADERVLVVVSTSAENDPSWIPGLRAVVEAELAEAGAKLLDDGAAATRFEERASSAPVTLSQSELDMLPERSHAAIRNLALGKYAAAKEELRAALSLADRGLEEVAREEERAKGVVDACLFMVRTYLESGNEKLAMEQVKRCRQMFPDVEPSSQQLHTPEVRELVKRADGELAKGPRGALIVDSRPRGCAMRLNGKRMGVTPARVDDLAAFDYRVQVECDPEGRSRGRVYNVKLNEGENRVFVDVPFDQAVRTKGGLSLAYATDAERDAFLLTHGVNLARAAGVGEVLIVSPELEAARARVDRVRVSDGKVIASSSLTAIRGDGSIDSPMVARVVGRLRARASVRFVGHDEEPMAPWQPPTASVGRASRAVSPSPPEADDEQDAPVIAPAAAADTPSRPGNTLGTGVRVLGVGLAVVGIAGIATGFVLHAGHGTDGDLLARTDPLAGVYRGVQQDWLDGRTLPIVLGGAGSALLTTGLALFLPGDDGVPWWGWVSGAAGLGVGAWGLINVLGGGTCDGNANRVYTQSCIDDEKRFGMGALMIMGAAPLLAVPLIAALRGAADSAGPAVAVSAEVAPGFATVVMSGRF
jgi:hypothetical protein